MSTKKSPSRSHETRPEAEKPRRFESLKGKQRHPGGAPFVNRPPASAFDGLDLSKLRP